jgi:transposase-like protein
VSGPADSPAGATTAGSGERAVPYHCPFCAEEDLRPHGTTHGAWHCRACLRVFAVRFLGIEGLDAAARAPIGQGGPR